MKKVLFILIALFSMAFSYVEKDEENGFVMVYIDGTHGETLHFAVMKNDYGRLVVALVSFIDVEYLDKVGGRPLVIENVDNPDDFIRVFATLSKDGDVIDIYDLSDDYMIIDFFKRVRSCRVSVLNRNFGSRMATTNPINLNGSTKLINNL